MRPLTAAGVQFLGTPRAQATLEALAAGPRGSELEVLGRLRDREGYAPDEAGWLLDQLLLRERARAKFPRAARMLFLREALEQASGHELATWRAERFGGYSRILDLGAGIGGDTLALAHTGRRVLAYERDPVRAQLLAHNLRALDLDGSVELHRVDWTRAELPPADAAFVDPARRRQGRRVLGLHAMEPPLAELLRLVARVPHVLVKVAPGLDPGELPPEAALEFVSLRGELKEALLGFGAFRREGGPRAVLLPGAHELADARELPPRVAAPGAFFYEPDPAVLRAGLVRALGERLAAWQLEPSIAYLSSDAARPTPFARCYRVLRQGRFQRKALARWLRELNCGRVVLKRRGLPIDPVALERRLPRSKGGPTRTCFLSRSLQGPWAIVAEPHEPAG